MRPILLSLAGLSLVLATLLVRVARERDELRALLVQHDTLLLMHAQCLETLEVADDVLQIAAVQVQVVNEMARVRCHAFRGY